jgi:hypothetical protein
MRRFLYTAALLGAGLMTGCPARKEPVSEQSGTARRPVVSSVPQETSSDPEAVEESTGGETATSEAPPASRIDAISEDGELTGMVFPLAANGSPLFGRRGHTLISPMTAM